MKGVTYRRVIKISIKFLRKLYYYSNDLR